MLSGAEPIPSPPEAPVRVIVFAVSRSGSSFLGELFNQHPSAFYSFEPLKGVYSALFGLDQDRENSQDVFTFVNGSAR